ncbi:hypothetical protein AAT19DRAFT_10537 [Rhodotorula toruloides]|uniref:F-box domain-containing protein n=1 Tax=Rhodotorula toruloides TaxID=5286 RepID=A0A0K3CT56_RHOTO|nr:hypothetical protein AAT19DRAFT_10537 [Rhodotorula toruloides]
MLPSLPLDVLPDILRWLDPLKQADFGALEDLSKVSRSFREATMPYLLSTVVERGIAAPSNKRIGWQDSDEDEDEDYFDPLEGDAYAGRALDNRTKRLLLLLARQPAFALLPTELVYYDIFEGGAAVRAVRRIFSACPNIQSVRLVQHAEAHVESQVNWPLQVLQTIAAERPGLRSLVVQGAHFRYVTEVLDDVCRFRNLKTLEVELLDDDWLWRWEDYGKKGSQVQSNLDRLIIGSPTTEELFDQLSGSSRSTVRTLGLSLLREPLDLSEFTQLKNLIVKACQYGVVRETLNTMPAGVTYLEIRESGVIAHLERLMRRQELRPHGDPIYDSDEEDEVCSNFEPIFGDAGSTIRTLLAGIPSHIKHLRLPQFYSSEDMQIITSSFASPTVLPQLHVFEIGNPLKDLYTDASEWDPEEVDRETALRERLREVCAARGVEIGPYDEHWGQVQSEEGTIPRALLLG